LTPSPAGNPRKLSESSVRIEPSNATAPSAARQPRGLAARLDRFFLRSLRGGYPSQLRFEERASAIERTAARFPVPRAAATALEALRRLEVSPVDIWHGSHIILRGDQGRMYEAWRSGARPRISSHYRNVPVQQYEISLGKNGALLFGLTPEGHTWLQTERHMFLLRRPLTLLEHTQDFLEYETIRQSIGPFGRSPHTERRPVEVAAADLGGLWP